MIRGSCLCCAVRFELERASGPFELCHCHRCRKASGSAFLPWLAVRREHFRFVAGEDLVRTYAAPLIEKPPPYRISFCAQCGSPVPLLRPESDWVEIPAGAFDDDPGARPDKHIFVEHRAAWYEIRDELPQMDKATLYALRKAASK